MIPFSTNFAITSYLIEEVFDVSFFLFLLLEKFYVLCKIVYAYHKFRPSFLFVDNILRNRKRRKSGGKAVEAFYQHKSIPNLHVTAFHKENIRLVFE